MSRRRTMQSQGSELPSGYVRCVYLESSGTQWIDTGITINGTHELNICFLFTTVPTGFIRIFGGRNSYKLKAYILVYESTGNFRFDYNNSVYKIPIQISQNEKYDVSISNSIFKINNYIISLASNNFISEAHYYIFYAHILDDDGRLDQTPCIKVYSFEIKDTIRLIPSIDPSGRPCMYDTVTQQPFYNQGTGEFGYELEDGTYVAPV